MPEGLTTVLALLSWGLENYNKLSRGFSGLQGWFKGNPGNHNDSGDLKESKERGILMIGPGGTGKTTLAELLSGITDLSAGDATKYNESIDVDRYTLKDAPRVELLVTPGQRHRRPALWPDLLSNVASGAYRGIVVFGSYGYHSLNSSYKNHELYRENTSKSKFLASYLQEAKEDEIEIVRKLIPLLDVAPNPPWLLHVITKQDIWWKQRLEAKRFYKNGTFGKILDELSERKPKIRFEQAFVSLTISNFRSGANELLKENAAGYDQRMQIDSILQLIEAFARIKHWRHNNEPNVEGSYRNQLRRNAS